MRAWIVTIWACGMAAWGAAQEAHWLTVDAAKGLAVPAEVTCEIFGFPKALTLPKGTQHPKPELADGTVHTLVLAPEYMLHSQAFTAPLQGVDTLALHPLAVGTRAALPWVTYIGESFRLDYHSMRSLEHVKAFMETYPRLSLRIHGVGDVESVEPCDRLGRRRARSVWEYLVTEGIAPSRIQLHGSCATDPEAPRISIAVEAL